MLYQVKAVQIWYATRVSSFLVDGSVVQGSEDVPRRLDGKGFIACR
jgi:hypothetical protein